MKELLSNKVFRIIIVTDVIQQMCIWIRNIAILFYIVEKTNSNPIAVSLITVFEYLPMFIFSYIGGTLADRWNPKRTMVIGDFLSSISVLCILFLASNGIWQAVFTVTLISSIVTQFSVPSSVIMFKRSINEKLITPAISISQALQSLYIIIGPILGTLFYTKFGLNVSLIIIAVLFLASSGVQLLLPSVKRVCTSDKSSIFSDMKQGISFIKSSSQIKTLCVIILVLGLAQGLIQPLGIYILSDRLLLPKESLQWFYTLSGVGLLLGAIISAGIVNKYKIKTILFTGFIIFSFITIVEAVSRFMILTAFMFLLSGIAVAFIQVAVSSPLIKNVSEELVGRINGLMTPLMTGGILLGSGISGILFKQLTLIPVFCISAGILLLCGIISLKYREEEHQTAESSVKMN